MVTRPRCLLVWLLLSLAAGTAGWAGGAAVGPAERFDQVVAATAGLALVACAAWAWIAGTVVVLQVLRSHGRPPHATPGVPRWVGRAVLAACGVAVVSAVPAQASPLAHPGPQHAATASVDGLPFPDRAVGPAGAAPAAYPERTQAAYAVVVRPGDSLWRVAERLLPADATDADVAATTRVLHDLNRAAIGPDPDVIHPGLRLRTPGS